MAIFNHIPKSSRRPTALQPSDYDHEIFLIDHSGPERPASSRSRSVSNPLAAPQEDTTKSGGNGSLDRRHSSDQLSKKKTLQREIAKRRYAKYQDRRDGSENDSQALRHSVTLASEPSEPLEGEDREANGLEEETEERGRPNTSETARSRKKPPLESAIDILYENQRGGFLCGLPLFSSKALGAADLPAWVNFNFKPSATNITNAQPPDPSWEWAWDEWKVNHDQDASLDDDGWEYSFMFSSKFSWHGPTWYNSYVRRRAWIRKRVRKDTGYKTMEGHMLNSDYFTIHPNQARSRSRSASRVGSMLESRYSAMAQKEVEEALDLEDIRDIGHLMKSLKYCRIDREKTEAVESFVQHGGDDLFYLKERMHEIMSAFIFQTSRKSLLTHLSQKLDEATESVKEGDETEEGSARQKRIDYLKVAIKAADEEVKRLEFWSDIKEIAEEGETKGAMDEDQGWTQDWRGLDNSGPKDVISEKKLPGFGDDGNDHESEGKDAENNSKGKGKAKE